MFSESFFEKIIGNIETADKTNLQVLMQRMARERSFFQLVFNAVKEGIIVIGADRRIQYANHAAQGLVGLPESYDGSDIRRYFRGLDWKGMQSADGSWKKNILCEIEILYPVRRLLLLYLVPLEGSGDSATIILHDLTESRSKTQETIESEKMHMISLLAAGVAHEIGNPLNSLHIHLQLLKRMISGESLDREKAAELVEVAGSEVERLDKIIVRFLDAVKSVKPNLVKLDIKPLIVDTLTSLRHEIENKKIDVKCIWEEGLPTVQGDELQLKQAFYNIVKNSVQAMQDGGRLDIDCAANDDSLTVSFADDGKGISAEDLPHVVEPYYTTRDEGSGLGMMIVERIIREHGAELLIDSEPGMRTVVSISFPLSTRKVRLLPPPQENGGK
ncbi:MAG: PAS domain-containing protein [Victivallales bacterium]|nr:PAS domain-containing protein [Victivallales bacterium]